MVGMVCVKAFYKWDSLISLNRPAKHMMLELVQQFDLIRSSILAMLRGSLALFCWLCPSWSQYNMEKGEEEGMEDLLLGVRKAKVFSSVHPANWCSHVTGHSRDEGQTSQLTVLAASHSKVAEIIAGVVCVKAFCRCFTKENDYPHPSPCTKQRPVSWSVRTLYCSGLFTHTAIYERHPEGNGCVRTSQQVIPSFWPSWEISYFICQQDDIWTELWIGGFSCLCLI